MDGHFWWDVHERSFSIGRSRTLIFGRTRKDAHGRSFLKGRSFSKGRSRTVIFERKDGHGRLFLVGRSYPVLFGRTLIGQVEDLDQGSQDQD